MAYEFRLPDLGEGLTEGEIARWLVHEGQEIAEDDPLVEIATDKTTVEIPSPAAGVVTKILIAEGEVVPVGTVLVVIGGNGAEPDAKAKAGERSDRVRATPLVRRLADELGVDLEQLEGTGPQGRITEADVRGTSTEPPKQDGRREPIRGIKREMFEHLTRAHREIPPVTWVEECDFSDVDLKQLINHPQVAILGVYRIGDRPVVRDGEIVVRRVGNVSVTFDHRVIDGKRAADFGLAVIERLQR